MGQQWDIHVSGVQSVVSRTQHAIDDLDKQRNHLATALEGAAQATQSGLVVTAMDKLAGAELPRAQFVQSRAQSCVNAAVRATNFYEEGDLQMAAHAQATASSAPEPAPLLPGDHSGNSPVNHGGLSGTMKSPGMVP